MERDPHPERQQRVGVALSPGELGSLFTDYRSADGSAQAWLERRSGGDPVTRTCDLVTPTVSWDIRTPYLSPGKWSPPGSASCAGAMILVRKPGSAERYYFPL